MYCPKCGTQNEDVASRCTNCGEILKPSEATPRPPSMGDDPVMRAIVPVGRSGLAIAAGYAGFFALLGFPAPIALVLGILAIIDLKKHPEKHGMGRALFGFITGLIGTILILGFLLT